MIFKFPIFSCLLLVCRNTVDCSVAVPSGGSQSLVPLGFVFLFCFLVDPWEGFSTHIFVFHFLPNSFLSHCTALAGTSSTTFPGSDEGLFCIISPLRKKMYSNSPFYTKWARDWLWMLFIKVRAFHFIPSVLTVLKDKWGLSNAKCFFYIYWDYHVVLLFCSITIISMFDWFSCIPLINLTWKWYFLYVLLDIIS